MSFRVSAGRAFRAPSLTELSMPELPLSKEGVIVANPDLAPEYVWSIETGALLQPLNWLQLDAALFYNAMDELISPVITIDTASLRAVVSYRNIATAWSGGCDLQATLTPLPWLDLSVGYALTQSRDVDLDVPLDYIPRHSGVVSLGLSYPFKRSVLQFSLSEQLVGERWFFDWQNTEQDYTVVERGAQRYGIPDPSEQVRLAPYARTDLSLGIAIVERLDLSVAAQNLFDARYEESGGTFATGRFITLRARLALGASP
jgi:outer membrane receptor protein involved in Fe transport